MKLSRNSRSAEKKLNQGMDPCRTEEVTLVNNTQASLRASSVGTIFLTDVIINVKTKCTILRKESRRATIRVQTNRIYLTVEN
jgi:hypothetical protein